MLGHFGSGLSEIVLFVVCENREKLNYFYLFLYFILCVSSTTVRGTYLNYGCISNCEVGTGVGFKIQFKTDVIY